MFKIVPCLNPDGVYRGYFRHDTLNQNLNRCYISPDPKLHPTIYAVKTIIKQQSNLKFYFDLHAHAVKKGCFIFGNHMTSHENQSLNMLLPKLISLNTLNFDFVECSFNEKLMTTKDRLSDGGLGWEGCGRVAIY